MLEDDDGTTVMTVAVTPDGWTEIDYESDGQCWHRSLTIDDLREEIEILQEALKDAESFTYVCEGEYLN